MFIILRTGKISLFRGVGKVHFSCLKCYSNLLLISQNKVRIGAFLQKTTRDSSRSYNNSPTASTTVIRTHAPPFAPSQHKIQKRMEATLIYTELPIYSDTKELATSSQFGLWMTKTSDKLSYLTVQPQDSFRNLSIYRKLIEPCLNIPELPMAQWSIN